MARDVAFGQNFVLHRYEHHFEKERAEQTARASRANVMLIGVDRQIASLEGVVQDAKTKTEENAQLLSGPASVVYALEGETSTLQQTIVMRCEEITQLTRSNDEMKES